MCIRFLRAILGGMAASSLISGASAQTAPAQPPSIDDQQKIATLEQTIATTKQANDANDLSIISAIQKAGSGAGGGSSFDGTAEAILVGHYALADAARKMAVDVRVKGGATSDPILVVYGSTPSNVGAYIEFKHTRDLLDQSLREALVEWDAASRIPVPVPVVKKTTVRTIHPKPSKLRDFNAPQPDQIATTVETAAGATGNPVGLAIAATTALLDLSRVDTTINGVSIPADAEQTRSIVSTELQDQSLVVANSEFELAQDPDDDVLGLKDFKADYAKALHDYDWEYITRLSRVGGTVAKLPAEVATAGAALKAALDPALAFEQKIYASANGVAAVSTIYAEKLLSDNVRGNKGFFVGITRSPSDFEGTSSIDYTFVRPTAGVGEPYAVRQQSSVSWTDVVHLWRVKQFLAATPLALPPGSQEQDHGSGGHGKRKHST